GTVGDIVCAPLDRAGLELAVIDLGARNGMYHVPASYSRRARLIGFEPNPKEYEKLTTGTTDMSKVRQAAPPFKRTEYHPFAVWRGKERRQFYITAVAGACTLMGESVPAVAAQMFLDSSMSPDRSKTGRLTSYADITRVVRTVPVDCVALDDVIADETIIDL